MHLQTCTTIHPNLLQLILRMLLTSAIFVIFLLPITSGQKTLNKQVLSLSNVTSSPSSSAHRLLSVKHNYHHQHQHHFHHHHNGSSSFRLQHTGSPILIYAHHQRSKSQNNSSRSPTVTLQSSESFESPVNENAIINTPNIEFSSAQAMARASLFSSMPMNETSIRDLQLVHENVIDIEINHQCKKPRARLFKIKELNADLRHFIPKCVYLHKCDDQSGCCKSADQHCVASQQEVIYKHFYLMQDNGRRVVKLSFVNDTQCSCRDVNNMPRAINGFYQDQEQQGLLKKLQEQNKRERELIKALQALTTNRTTTRQSIDFSSSSSSSSTIKDQQLTSNEENEVPDDDQLKKLPNKSTKEMIGVVGQDSAAIISPMSVFQKTRRNLFFCDQRRRCPDPLRMQRLKEQPDRCFCACLPNEYLCIRVLLGLKRLEDSELKCVQKGDCHSPDCFHQINNGKSDFDLQSGFCPKYSAKVISNYPRN